MPDVSRGTRRASRSVLLASRRFAVPSPRSPIPSQLQHLPQHYQPAAEILHKRPGGFVDEGGRDLGRSVGPGRGSEEQDPAAEAKEGLDAVQELLLHPNGPHTHEVLRLVQFGPRQQVLCPGRFHRRVRQVQVAGGLSQECRLPSLRLDHDQLKGGNRELQRNGRRTPAGADVDQARARPEVRTMAVTRGSMQVPRGNQRLDEQPVDGLVWGVL